MCTNSYILPKRLAGSGRQIPLAKKVPGRNVCLAEVSFWPNSLFGQIVLRRKVLLAKMDWPKSPWLKCLSGRNVKQPVSPLPMPVLNWTNENLWLLNLYFTSLFACSFKVNYRSVVTILRTNVRLKIMCQNNISFKKIRQTHKLHGAQSVQKELGMYLFAQFWFTSLSLHT